MIDGNTRGMTMRYPATRWQDALPVGSGIVGALVYGSINKDTIVLNHDALFYPRGKAQAVDVSALLPEVRRLIDEGKCREAAEVMPNAYTERTGIDGSHTSAGRDPYQPFCALTLATPTDGPFRAYRRGVDFETGRAWVEWTDDSATYTREVFVSRVTDAVFLRIKANRPGSVTCRVSLDKAPCEQSGENAHSSSLPGDVELSAAARASIDDQQLSFDGAYPNGFSFGAVGRVTAPGGTVSATDETLLIEGADELVLQVKLWLGENDGPAEPASFDSALAEHSALHRELFNGVTLSLGTDDRQSNENMLMDAMTTTSIVALIESRLLPPVGRFSGESDGLKTSAPSSPSNRKSS